MLGVWIVIATLVLGVFPVHAQVPQTRFDPPTCSGIVSIGGFIAGFVPPDIDLGDDTTARAIVAQGFARLRKACPDEPRSNRFQYQLAVLLYQGGATREAVRAVATSEADRASGRLGPEEVEYWNAIADERKRQEEARRQRALEAERARQAEAEAARQAQLKAQDRLQMQAFLQAHQAIHDPAADRQSAFVRAFLLNPFAYEEKVIALRGVLKNMFAPGEGVFRVYQRFIDRWSTDEEFIVVSGLPKGFNPPNGEALLVGEVLGKIDMLNGVGATMALPHLHIRGVCTVSEQELVHGVATHTCRDVKNGREVMSPAVQAVAVPPTPTAQPSPTPQAAPQPEPESTPTVRETRQEVTEKSISPADQRSDTTRVYEYVQSLIKHAVNEGVVDNEADILTVKHDIEALNLKSQVVQRQRKKAREANERGLQQLRAGEVAGAVQAFRTAAEADPADIEVLNNLGHAYFWQSDLPRAEEWLLRTLTMAPGRSSAWSDLGQVYARQGDGTRAVGCFANAYRFARNQDVSRRFFQGLTDDESQHAAVREAARQVLQLRLVQAQP